MAAETQGGEPQSTEPRSSRSAEILERILDEAGADGERLVAWVRLTLGAGLLVRLFFLAFPEGNDYGVLRFWVPFGGIVLALANSAFVLTWLRRHPSTTRLLLSSVVLDAVAIFVAVSASVIWPRPDYPGLMRHPDLAFFLVATVAAGIRLSRRVALAGAGLNTLAGVGLLVMDTMLNAERQTFGASSVMVGFILQLGAASLGFVIATRTRRLVYAGAGAAVQADRARRRLETYVSEEVAEEAMAHTELILGGRRQPVTVLFSDLRGFTSYTERVTPESLVLELNSYLEAMVRVIRTEGGTIDKYIGDAIMVVYGVPEPRPDDAARALRTAAGMREALTAHNRARESQGLEPLRHGIGIHHGPAVAGNIGTAERLQYTVVGDVVNIASRLENATKREGCDVVISAAAVEAARAAEGESLPAVEAHGTLELRGSSEAIEVYRLG